jgi:hypothetical protein
MTCVRLARPVLARCSPGRTRASLRRPKDDRGGPRRKSRGAHEEPHRVFDVYASRGATAAGDRRPRRRPTGSTGCWRALDPRATVRHESPAGGRDWPGMVSVRVSRGPTLASWAAAVHSATRMRVVKTCRMIMASRCSLRYGQSGASARAVLLVALRGAMGDGGCDARRLARRRVVDEGDGRLADARGLVEDEPRRAS